MPTFLELPRSFDAIAAPMEDALARVRVRFDQQLDSDLPPMQRLVEHLHKYRGKMLRPVLTVASAMAAAPNPPASAITDHVITAAAVVEMIHMATLVHDDVLDESATRRGVDTVNRLHGNETAVILGDYLIAAAYHLCSQLPDPAYSLRTAAVAMTLCAGELLQLSHREDFSIDEPTYFELIERKTASLIALACHMGASLAGAPAPLAARLEQFGVHIGVAFQIQDDLLDLTAHQAALGKPVGQDLAKGKLTLPLIHHLTTADPIQRGRSLALLRRAAADPAPADAARHLRDAIGRTGSIAHAAAAARQRVDQAIAQLDQLPAGPPADLLRSMARAVVDRSA